MIEISEVLYQWQQGRSKSKIAESLGISRPTLRNYLKLAMAAGLKAGSSPDETAVVALAVQSKVFGSKTVSAPALEAISIHEERIRELLKEPDMTARQVWRLLSEAGHTFSERSINRYVQLIDPFGPAVTIRLEVDRPPGSG